MQEMASGTYVGLNVSRHPGETYGCCYMLYDTPYTYIHSGCIRLGCLMSNAHWHFIVMAICMVASWHESYGNAFRMTDPFWGNPPIINGFLSQKHKGLFMWSMNMSLNKHSYCWWFVTLWSSYDVTVMCLQSSGDLRFISQGDHQK